MRLVARHPAKRKGRDHCRGRWVMLTLAHCCFRLRRKTWCCHRGDVRNLCDRFTSPNSVTRAVPVDRRGVRQTRCIIPPAFTSTSSVLRIRSHVEDVDACWSSANPYCSQNQVELVYAMHVVSRTPDPRPPCRFPQPTEISSLNFCQTAGLPAQSTSNGESSLPPTSPSLHLQDHPAQHDRNHVRHSKEIPHLRHPPRASHTGSSTPTILRCRPLGRQTAR